MRPWIVGQSFDPGDETLPVPTRKPVEVADRALVDPDLVRQLRPSRSLASSSE